MFGAVALLALLNGAYPGVTPLPRSTDAHVLHAQAAQREISERIDIGFKAIERSEWSSAAAEFQRVLALHPVEPQASTAYYDLGIAQSELGKFDDAAANFREAIARDPGFLAARSNLVGVELQRGDLTAARKAADDLLALAPDSARALYAHGITALRAGDGHTALDDFRALSARDPKYAVAHYDIALAEQRLGDYASAERELRTALELAPTYARAGIALGAVLLHEGKKEEARTVFDDAARNAQDVALRTLALSLRDATH